MTVDELLKAWPDQMALVRTLNDLVDGNPMTPELRAHAVHASLARQISLIEDDATRDALIRGLLVTLEICVAEYRNAAQNRRMAN